MNPRRAHGPPPLDPHAARRRTAMLLAVGLLLLGLLLRIARLWDGLWYDEIITIAQYMVEPWRSIVSGAYSPNNHVLYTLLAKAADTLVPREDPTLAARLPAVLAGAAVGAVLAGRLWAKHPFPALLLAAVATLHPWLIDISGWARGYSLLLFLAVLSTDLLARRAWRGYALALVAMLYTHPLGIGVVLGHAATFLLPQRRADLKPWLLSAAAAGLAVLLLYLPFAAGAKQYWAGPQRPRPAIAYSQFLQQSFRYAHAGENLPNLANLLLPLLACTAGAALAFRRWHDLRPIILTFAGASAFGLLVPLLIPPAGEVRAMLWLIPLYSLGLFGILTSLPFNTPWRFAAIAAALLLALFLLVRNWQLTQTPAQPMLEAVELARSLAQPGQKVIGIYMGTREAQKVYGGIDLIAYSLQPHPDLPNLKAAEAASSKPPLAIVFYEDLLRRDQPELWAYLQQHYTLQRRLPGRIAPAALYLRNP